MQKKQYLALGIIAVFLVGVGVILYFGRPVIRMQNQEVSNQGASVTVADVNSAESKTVVNAIEEAVSTPVSAKDLPNENAKSEPVTPPATPTSVDPNSYTMADIQAHATESDCWAVVNGSVYDLSSWVSRHPGGESPIKKLCGIDASANFNRKHGTSPKPQAALILLKIGSLQQ